MGFFDKFRRTPSAAPDPTTDPPPFTYQHTLEMGMALEKEGHKGAARDMYRNVANDATDGRGACHLLGLSYMGEDWAQAANWFGQVLKRSNENDELKRDALAFLAQCFHKMGDDKQAVKCLQGLHAFNPTLAEDLAETLGLLKK
jgi:tetratricopeptide (TPR) repeat protein